MDWRPGYLDLYEDGELARRAETAMEGLGQCVMCAHACRSDRLHGELGLCRTGRRAVVASLGRHFGEEEVLVGTGGSGTIFCQLQPGVSFARITTSAPAGWAQRWVPHSWRT